MCCHGKEERTCMQLRDVIARLPLEVIAGEGQLDTEVTGGYASDLLSNVMGQASAGNIWVTAQAHQNIVAVASLTGLAAVIIAGGFQPEQETILKAKREKIILLSTPLPAFEVVGLLYRMGISGV